MRTRLLVIALYGGALCTLRSETLPSRPDRYFNDYAGVVDRSAALELNEELAQFERETSTQNGNGALRVDAGGRSSSGVATRAGSV